MSMKAVRSSQLEMRTELKVLPLPKGERWKPRGIKSKEKQKGKQIQSCVLVNSYEKIQLTDQTSSLGSVRDSDLLSSASFLPL